MSDRNNVFAQHLPEELRDQDPSKLFPDFEHGDILRFTRIFEGTFRGGGDAADPGIFDSQLWEPSRTFRPRQGGEERQEEPEHSLDLNFGPTPSKSQCCMDENDLLCATNLDHMLPNNFDAMKPRRHFRRVYRYRTPFRLGKIWDTPLEEGELREEEGHQTLSDHTFLPVNFVPWEDDVIIDPEKAKTKLIAELSKCAKKRDKYRLPKCGWIPTEKTPTFKEFMTAWRNGSFLKYLENPTNIQRKSKVPIIPIQSKKRNFTKEQKPSILYSIMPQFPIFPKRIDGPEWEDGSGDSPWEERVIWGN